ncbi:MAG: DUF5362 domain-containing protein [Bacteroidales bacterium]|nr:DUF5362 domain-containing protein [Bacteroidales bacterium]
MSSNVPRMSTYMSFIGLITIIGGALYCITIVGAIIGIPCIFMGIRLRESAQAFKQYLTSNSNQDLSTAIDRQTKAFFIQYVLTIIGLVLLGIYIIVIIAILASGGF